MPKASEVAAELRRIADAFDGEPEAEVQQAWITFYCSDKNKFLATARLLPRPVFKTWDDEDKAWDRLHVGSKNYQGHIHVDCSIPRSTVCRLVKEAQPAEYDCEPLLSDEEEASLVPHEQ